MPTDQVVLETTINAWTFYDQLVPLVSRGVVANPAQVKLIAASLVKTDKRETLALARLLALVGYVGLGARIHASGQVQRSGSITKSGRTELRTVLVEAAWTSVRTSSWSPTRFPALTARMPAAKAIVVIARKLLVVIWHVLTARCRSTR